MQSNNLSNSATDELHSQKVTIGIAFFVAGLSIIAMFTVTLNGIFLIGVLKKRLLNTPSNYLLGILCCNDLLIGLIALPLYICGVSQRRTWLIFEGDILRWGSFFNYVFQGLSFQLLALVSLDRYAAICHPYKYINHATRKLYTGILVCTALTYLIFTTSARLIIKGDTTAYRYVYANIYTIAFSAVIFVCSWKIYRVIKCKVRDTYSTTGSNTTQVRLRQIKRDENRGYGVLLLVSVHYLCYLPFYICLILIHNHPSIFRSEVNMTFVKRWSFFPLFLNGTFNPLIYYFRMTNFCAAVREIMCCFNT